MRARAILPIVAAVWLASGEARSGEDALGVIIVPALGHKYLPYSFGVYRPTPTEIIVAGSTFAAMTLLYVLFAKVVPISSIWELKAGAHPSPELAPPATKKHRLGDVHL